MQLPIWIFVEFDCLSWNMDNLLVSLFPNGRISELLLIAKSRSYFRSLVETRFLTKYETNVIKAYIKVSFVPFCNKNKGCYSNFC